MAEVLVVTAIAVFGVTVVRHLAAGQIRPPGFGFLVSPYLHVLQLNQAFQVLGRSQ
jgi:hypothetical protein